MKFLSLIGALAIIIAVAAVVFFFGGFYNVAATQPDLVVVAWALEYIRDASINRHAVDQPPVSMEDPATIQVGARAFASRGCPSCHGGPGVMWAKFSEGLRPDPPDLKDVVKDLTPAQIFWVIRNGINMTGMPGFNLVEATDLEIWNIAAFVKKLPTVSEADYRVWTTKRTRYQAKPHRQSSGGCRSDLANHRATRRSPPRRVHFAFFRWSTV
jgi:mono/diheme cytochrome c family protein